MVRITPRKILLLSVAGLVVWCLLNLIIKGNDNEWHTLDFHPPAKIKRYNISVSDEAELSPDASFPRERSGKLRVLVVASKRSGSSFFGELFNRNPDFVYFFEPLTYLTFESQRMKYGNDVFDRKAVEVIGRLLKWDLSPLAVIAHTRAVGRICARGQAMASTLYCKTSPKRAPGQSITLSELRHAKEHIAIKTIRLYDLGLLRSLASDPAINLKIIHLVRDPRGTWNSRLNLNKTNYDFKRRRTPWDEVTDLCTNMLDTLKAVYKAPHWLRGKFFLARYEDMALNPLEMATRIYQFLEIPLPGHVREWVRQHTKENKRGHFATTRNSTSVVAQWRHQLPARTVFDIQSKCHAPMKMLGYVEILHESDLTNTSFSVVKDGPNIFL